MAEQYMMENLDSLLLQLALQTRELSSRKDTLQQHIKVSQANILQRKTYVEETKKTIERLDEQIRQKQKTVQHHKDNTQGLKRTHCLLLQYETILESELERRQENCNRDTQMYNDRVEGYKLVLKKQREKYHQHPLAKRLLKIQAENEEIERRIRDCEEQIATKEEEQQALLEAANDNAQVNAEESVSQGQIEGPNDLSQDDTSHPSSQQSAVCDAEVMMERAGKQSAKMEEIGARELGREQSRRAATPSADLPTGASPGEVPSWTSPRARTAQREEIDRTPGNGIDQEDDSFNMSGLSEEKGDEFEGMNMGSQEQRSSPGLPGSSAAAGIATTGLPSTGASDMGSSGDGQGSPTTPSTRMKAVMNTPTFTLGSPGAPPSDRGSSEDKSPAFVFSFNSEPSTPAFPGFSFDMGSGTQEESPFAFTSEYFCSKKSPEPNFSGFPFNQSENRGDNGFQFSFSKSPPHNPIPEEKTSNTDSFPFSFNFGKF